MPYGDAALTGLRGELVPPAPGEDGGMLDLGGFYGLHPALANLHAMYRAGEALAVHAVAGPYRARSHFEAQDYLESGADHRMTSGWLNRALAALPPPTAHGEAMAIGMSVPLLLRGPASVANWAPHGTATLDADLYARIAALNHDDSVLGPAIAEGLSERGFSAAVLSGDEPAQNRNAFPALAKAAGEMLGAENGPRIAALEIGGWDTHAGQATAPRRRAAPTRRRAGGTEDGARRGVAADRGADHDRVRPDRADERHQRHRPWDRHCRVRRWEARCPADASWRTGLVSAPAGCSRIATCSRRWTCGRWPRGCSPCTSASASSALAVVFPDSAAAEPMRDLIRTID